MLKITPVTMNAFEEKALLELAKLLLPDLRKELRDELAEIGDEDVLAMTLNGFERAQLNGFKTPEGLAGWAWTMFEFAPNFNEYPKAARILDNRSLSEEDRIRSLHRNLSLDDWNAIIDAHDDEAWITA